MIGTEEEYNKTLERLVKGAEYLENPFLQPEQRDKAQKLYDTLETQIRAYKEAKANGRVKYLADTAADSESRAS